jgi:elongation factor P
MTLASSIRSGALLRVDGDLYKVIESVLHAGGGKAGSMVHAKLRSLSTGHIQERRWAPDDKVEDVAVETVKMQFLYSGGDQFTFMNPETYDQIPIGRTTIGPAADFLKENDVLEVEFSGDKPVSVHYPDMVTLRVASTGAGIRGQTDSTFKEATLENGIMILVPQFIEVGDLIEVVVQEKKYFKRVQEKQDKAKK